MYTVRIREGMLTDLSLNRLAKHEIFTFTTISGKRTAAEPQRGLFVVAHCRQSPLGTFERQVGHGPTVLGTFECFGHL